MMETVIIRYCTARVVRHVMGALVFVAGGVFLLVTGEDGVFAWLSIVFFGGYAMFCIWQLVDRRAGLVIDDRGIFDRKLNVGVIDWHDIRGAYVDRVAGTAVDPDRLRRLILDGVAARSR